MLIANVICNCLLFIVSCIKDCRVLIKDQPTKNALFYREIRLTSTNDDSHYR